MYASISFTTQIFNELLVESHIRRLLIQNPVDHQSLTNSPTLTNNHNSTDSNFGDREFDSKVVMILAVILCVFICSLALNSIIRCALRFSNVAINNDSSSSNSNSSLQSVNKGIKKKALKAFPTVSYSTDLKLPSLDAECMICLSEFTKGEKVRILPKCNHGFHVRCIDKWLKEHSSCPKCRQCLLETCRKIGGSQVQPIVLPVPEIIIRIEPLEHEALERNYREI
ncbi:putative transcription factor C2H2 family [Medicago truncatula]|uniref:RING-type E3 ubiquitin transferase n=1 Tax=Medicago truncatula TaxID=3880 RepID=G7LD40_MEDTR|nr:RING-H2 finger protein ATL78 [Medicago truncatula]AET04679.1 RING-H2 finger protein ATL1L [Medicago truncatula]RHN43075.1 putative transcription factor C2H2 family [Medicago truncatula]